VLKIKTTNLVMNEKWECNGKNIHPPGEYVFISVTNTGSTISEELMDKIFEPFFSTKFSGRGMGLAAAKGIVRNHDGCITAESYAAQTTFNVFLPREISEQDIIKAGRRPSSDLPGLKVLVVDDDPQVLTTIKNLLDHQGCKVISTDKGKAALDIIARDKDDIDLVILDIKMPDMSGDKVYSRLKEIRGDIKVLISSGHEEYIALKNILLDPKDKFIKKPFRMSELILKIAELIALD
jgi:CheY-like chemotaxis protein